MRPALDVARECADFIGREVARLGQWKGLGSALARGNVEKHLAALIEADRAEAEAGALRAVIMRGIGAIEACAVAERGGPPVNWTAVDATQDAMRAARDTNAGALAQAVIEAARAVMQRLDAMEPHEFDASGLRQALATLDRREQPEGGRGANESAHPGVAPHRDDRQGVPPTPGEPEEAG
jgi:hypothetical protein